jgi:hypothetical protein
MNPCDPTHSNKAKRAPSLDTRRRAPAAMLQPGCAPVVSQCPLSRARHATAPARPVAQRVRRRGDGPTAGPVPALTASTAPVRPGLATAQGSALNPPRTSSLRGAVLGPPQPCLAHTLAAPRPEARGTPPSPAPTRSATRSAPYSDAARAHDAAARVYFPRPDERVPRGNAAAAPGLLRACVFRCVSVAPLNFVLSRCLLGPRTPARPWSCWCHVPAARAARPRSCGLCHGLQGGRRRPWPARVRPPPEVPPQRPGARVRPFLSVVRPSEHPPPQPSRACLAPRAQASAPPAARARAAIPGLLRLPAGGSARAAGSLRAAMGPRLPLRHTNPLPLDSHHACPSAALPSWRAAPLPLPHLGALLSPHCCPAPGLHWRCRPLGQALLSGGAAARRTPTAPPPPPHAGSGGGQAAAAARRGCSRLRPSNCHG